MFEGKGRGRKVREGSGEREGEGMEVKLLVVLERGTLERKGEAIGKRERKG